MINRARDFAMEAHTSIDHRRKYTNDPYIVHPAAVAKLVSSVTDNEEMICAAWLHDTVEDTGVTIDDIEKEFGKSVASLVSDLTDVSKPEDGNRKARKKIDLWHTAVASPQAKTVKLADLIDNSRTITQYDPGFAKIYMAEKSKLLEVLTKGDITLYRMAYEIVNKYYLGKEIRDISS